MVHQEDDQQDVTEPADDPDHPPPQGRQHRPNQETIDAIIADICGVQEFENVYVPEFKRRKISETEHTTATETGTDTEEVKEEPEMASTDTTNTSFEEIIIPPATVMRKREIKEKHKAAKNAIAAGKQACDGCHIQFWQLQMVQEFKICHNCKKIVQAKEATAAKHHGTSRVVRISPKTIGIEIHCHRAHTWVTDFKAKQGQKWCNTCRKIEKAEFLQQIREEEEKERERMAREQEQMFQQFQAQFQQQVEVEQQEIAIDPNIQFIQQVIDQIVAQQDARDAIDIDAEEIHHRFVDAIIAVEHQGIIDDVFIPIFDAIGEEQQARVERRIKFMLHPDKNSHRMAKQAFQMLSNSCWRRRKNKSKSSYKSFSMMY